MQANQSINDEADNVNMNIETKIQNQVQFKITDLFQQPWCIALWNDLIIFCVLDVNNDLPFS